MANKVVWLAHRGWLYIRAREKRLVGWLTEAGYTLEPGRRGWLAGSQMLYIRAREKRLVGWQRLYTTYSQGELEAGWLAHRGYTLEPGTLEAGWLAHTHRGWLYTTAKEKRLVGWLTEAGYTLEPGRRGWLVPASVILFAGYPVYAVIG